ncbi:WD40/YVTN/BNR-like repeat-containing protein [Marinospirillum perlucidum]|uniref:WD40/YVTN/BNR-like repeat-containing protein n=1 Tax=Marinospirillum perlucidum TaxID=1982602 RepID=UPI000DF1F56C|nr:YCF48-related protein [Marinospirillum perlucidum]
MRLLLGFPVFSLVIFLILGTLPLTPVAAEETLLRPALESDKAKSSLLLDITSAGERLVAVGERGHILYRDPGQDWQQAQVPVIAQLTGVDFATPQIGFAVGHEGLILRSRDAGAHWEIVHHELQAGPERAQARIPEMEERIAAAEEDATTDPDRLDDLYMQLDNLYFQAEAEEVPPLLDVLFISEQEGFAVGGYGLFLTTRDGGDTWTSLSQALPNPEAFHNNALAQDSQGRLFIAGERGRLYVSSDGGQTWETRNPGYSGSFFGLFTTSDQGLVVTGLRGHLFITRDAGENWQALEHPGEQTLNGGLPLEDGRLLVVGQNGEYLLGQPQALQTLSLTGRSSLVAVARQRNEIIAVGRGGFHRLTPLPAPAESR